MGNYKVCVYAICKNESQFVRRWMASMGEADEIYVLDTGSEDDTAEQLAELGAKVTVEEIRPWRFDKARNRSLALVPEDADICVCTDLDEVLRPGWREKVEQAWQPGAARLHYRYTWSYLADGREGVVFWTDKIHRRHGCRWVNPVHEVLQMDGGEGAPLYAEGVALEHHPDPTKSRGQYLPLLELAVEEDPENDRNTHYLGREYFFYRRWEDSERTLKRHLSLPTATWADERCASMRLLAKDCLALGREEEGEQWLLRAAAEAPHLREPWLDLALFHWKRGHYDGVVWLAERALTIRERPRTYMTEAAAWGSLPYDLASLGYYYTGRREKALSYLRKGLEIEPENPRLLENLRIMEGETQPD